MHLSVLVASSGRPTLERTLASIVRQIAPGDELLVDVNDDAPAGHRARNRMMPRAAGDALLFMDDDDIYTHGAIEVVRAAAAAQPDSMHVFRMRYADGQTLWSTPEVIEGQVSTQIICVPAQAARACQWSERYAGDFDFALAVAGLVPVRWHEDVIALVRPDGG